MKKSFNKNQNFKEEKVVKLKLTLQKDKSLKINHSSSQQSKSSIKISKGSKGITVDNKTVIFNTRYEESGRFNKVNGKVADNKAIGQRVKSAIKYQDRETELEKEKELEVGESLDKNMSHSYDLEKRLSKEEIKEINNELDKGVPAMRTSILSLKQEGNLTDKEELAIIQKAISEHNSKYNKNIKTVISLHKDTNNRHFHIAQFGSKDDIKMTAIQVEDFKLRVATLTKNELDNRGISHKLDKEINQILDKQEKVLQIEHKLENLQDKIKDVSQERLNSIDKETDKIVNKLNFSNEQLDAIKNYEKANGYKQFLEKQDNPDTAKIQKADSWKQDSYNKMDDITKDKHTELKAELDKFNNSEKLESINNKFKEDSKSIYKETSQELKDLSKEYKSNFFRTGDDKHAELLDKTAQRIEHQANNFDNKKFKKTSLDSVLNKAEGYDRETANDSIKEVSQELKQISKDMKKENNSSYNNEQKGGLFLEHDKVSKNDADEIKNTLKGLDEQRSSSKIMDKVAKSTDMKDKLESAQSERFKHSKNQQSAEFRAAQTKFFNSQAVMRNEVDLNKIDTYVDFAIKNGKMTQENGERFKENAKNHANELTKGGILKQTSDTEFKFTDEKSREILYDNHDKSIKEISSINKEDLKDFKREMDVYKKTNNSKDLKRVQQDIKNQKDKKQIIKKENDFRNTYLK